MTQVRGWVLGWALLGACVGPRGEQGSTAVHPTPVESSGPEFGSVEEAPHASAEPDLAPAGPETPSEPAPADDANPEAHVAETATVAAPVSDEGVTSAEGVDENENAESEAAQAAPNPALVRQGRQVFTSTCMLCHDMGPRIAGLGWAPQRMERQIRRGGKRMSAISTAKLPNPKLKALMAYLRTIGAVRADPPNVFQSSRQ